MKYTSCFLLFQAGLFRRDMLHCIVLDLSIYFSIGFRILSCLVHGFMTMSYEFYMVSAFTNWGFVDICDDMSHVMLLARLY